MVMLSFGIVVINVLTDILYGVSGPQGAIQVAMADANVARTLATEAREPNKLGGFFKKLFRHHPLGAFGLVITVAFLLTAVFAEQIAPYDMNESNINKRLQPPSREFWLGSDLLGRDMFSRIIIGTRTSLTIGLAAAALSVVIALILGILSATWVAPWTWSFSASWTPGWRYRV